MDYSLMSEDDILKDIGRRIEALRLDSRIKESALEEISGVSRKTYYNFKNGKSGLSLRNFIRILRAINQVDRLQRLFPESDSYSPANPTGKSNPKRVRGKDHSPGDYKWGDE